MGEKAGGALFALVFAVCFGGVGVFSGAAMGTALWEGIAARDWIRVRAHLVKYDGSGIAYKYRLNDRDYMGERIGVGWLQNSEIDDEVESRLNAARDSEKPLTVFVNPADPSKSLVDPQIPWTMLAFLTPFAFGFGGVGLGATYMVFHILFGSDKKKETARGAVPAPIKTTAGGETLGLWIFAFFWNVISFPIALVAVPEIIASGEWIGLLVLLFPLVGVLMIWGAINSTIRMLRRGPTTLVLASQEPRMGLPLSGHVTFSRGAKRGDHFRAKLSAHYKGEDRSTALHAWHKDASLQVIEGPDGPRVNFRFDVPSRLPPTVDLGDYEDLTWILELYLPQQTREAAYKFELGIEPAPDVASGQEMVGDEEAHAVPAGLPAGFEGLAALVGHEKLKEMPDKDRARLHSVAAEMTPEQRAQVAKLIEAGPLIKKLVIAVVVLFFVVQIVGVVIAFAFSS